MNWYLLPAIAAVATSVCAAQAAAGGYSKPPQNILEVMHVPQPPVPLMSPAEDTVLFVSRESYPSIERVARPYLKLGGVRVEPHNRSRHDTPGGYGIVECNDRIELMRLAEARPVRVAFPPGSCPGEPRWSADGKRFAVTNTVANSVDLWIGDVSTGLARRIPGVRLNPMFNDEIRWMADQRTLLVKLVPDNQGPPPAAEVAQAGPSIQESTGEKGQSSTYEARDTLRSRSDEDRFDYYGVSQLALVNVVTGAVTRVGGRANYESIDPPPDGKHVLVTSIHRPYSYVTAYDRFPRRIEVWNVSSPAHPVIHQIADLPLTDRVPIHGVPMGARDFEWVSNQPATLIWAEALDRGDWSVTVPARDKLMRVKAPFSEPPVEIARTEQRYGGYLWAEKPDLALLFEYDNNRRWIKGFLVNPEDKSQKPRLLWDRSTQDQYRHPGMPVMRTLASGRQVLRLDGDSIFLRGTGASPEGARPFLDRLNLRTLETERLFRSDRDSVEAFVGFAGSDSKTWFTWRQSPTDPPNLFRRTLGGKVSAPPGEASYDSSRAALTHFPDPAPQVRAIQKRLVRYKRADGLDLSFTLYTPPGYQEGTRVPAILNAYPLDFAESSTAGQVSGSQRTFTRLANYRLLLLAGYAIIDQAAFPIVGDPKKAYDTYLEQLVADAEAAVKEAVRIGVVDPNRIGVTGHSHGALMTANLVAHSKLFRAGVATSGSYNKTLTPFGFQNERRSVWEAPGVYTKASPFFVADQMQAPLLIVHGADDANPGTTPLQADKLYEAIRGNGGVTRLVVLPHEPHWYTAKESNEQLVYEMLRWFDRYVKNAPASN